MNKKLKIGLFGFGCVGQGLYHVLNKSTGFKADIRRIVVKDPSKQRQVEPELISYNKWDILDDPEIDVVVELIDHAEEAFEIVREALKRRKHVVTANKKMLALHLEELYRLQEENQVSLLYEAAACGSIPIIRTLEEYFDNEELEKISGIFNGTTNYILTKTVSEKLSYQEALRQAQVQGFAESDPTNDVEGYDPKFKAIILALHAFGLIIRPDDVLNIGINTLHEHDLTYASEKGYKVKLTPVIRRLGDNQVGVFVLPRFIKPSNQLYNVDYEFNGVVAEGTFSGEQFLQGRGAGSLPTGAAVLSDISALSYGYRYEFKKYAQKHAPQFTNRFFVNVYLRYQEPADLDALPFREISERYTGGKYNYVVGQIALQELIRQRSYILERKLFVALVNDEVQLPEQQPQHLKQTELSHY